MTTIEETYRVTRQDGSEVGLMMIETTLTDGQPLYSHSVSILGLCQEALPSGDYKLEFVKRMPSPDIYRRIRRSFRQLVSGNDAPPRP